jgi:hypothetical protein
MGPQGAILWNPSRRGGRTPVQGPLPVVGDPGTFHEVDDVVHHVVNTVRRGKYHRVNPSRGSNPALWSTTGSLMPRSLNCSSMRIPACGSSPRRMSLSTRSYARWRPTSSRSASSVDCARSTVMPDRSKSWTRYLLFCGRSSTQRIRPSLRYGAAWSRRRRTPRRSPAVTVGPAPPESSALSDALSSSSRASVSSIPRPLTVETRGRTRSSRGRRRLRYTAVAKSTQATAAIASSSFPHSTSDTASPTAPRSDPEAR